MNCRKSSSSNSRRQLISNPVQSALVPSSSERPASVGLAHRAVKVEDQLVESAALGSAIHPLTKCVREVHIARKLLSTLSEGVFHHIYDAVVKELAGHADISTTLRYYASIRAADMAEARNVTADALRLDAKWTKDEVKAVR